MKKLTVGFVGFGEVNTPRALIEAKCRGARTYLAELDLTVVETAPVADDPAGADVARAIRELSNQSIETLVICIAGWIPSHAVIRVIGGFRHLPMLLWGLAGHYEGNRLITTADQAGTTALRKTMQDLGYTFTFVYECAGARERPAALAEFFQAAKAIRALGQARVGMMGYRDMNLYATLHDGVSLKKALGVEVEVFEMLEMVQRMEKVSSADVRALVDDVARRWHFESPAAPETLEKSARCFLALKGLIVERRYDSVSLIDVDGMKRLLQLPPAMVLMLIADDLGLPTIPENDALGAVTQLVVRYLTGQAAPYFEFYEFLPDRVLIGVPDYVPTAVVDGEIRVRPTRFGGFSEGILNVSKVRTGRVTLARLLPHGGGYGMHVVTGTAVEARPWEEAGWAPPAPQLPSLEVILDKPVEEFAEEVAAQHYILSYGNNYRLFKAFARLVNLVVV